MWIANYTTGHSPGMLAAGWTDWGLWQYTSAGTVKGIPTTGHTDLDWFNPDSAIVHGRLMVFNPGYQQDTAGSGAQVAAQVQAYPEEPSPNLSFSATGLPSNLTLDSASGEITGTAAGSDGPTPITVAVADSTSGLKRRISFTWYSHGTLALASPGDQAAVAGSPVDLQLGAASDSPPAPPVSYQAAGLPPGLAITSAGLISRWPDAAGTYQVLVEAADGLKAPASETFTWTVTAAPDAGPTGAFRLELGGKCLNDTGDSSASGTPADLWTCNGSTAQRWTYVPDFTVRIHGKCLSAPAGPGGKVRLLSCGGRASQVWRPLSPRTVNPSAGGRAIAFVNPPSGMCLSDATWSTANGTAVVGAACDGYRDQDWTIPAGPVVSQLPGKCLDDRYGRTSDGNPIGMWSCTGTGRQRWTAAPDGTFRVEGKCLEPDGGATAAGTKMVLWGCDGSAAQQWRLIPDGDGEDLLNHASGLCLTDVGNKTWNGAPLKLEPCAAAPGQRWQVQ